MASREAITLVLGAQSFAIRPLTIGQVERLEEAIAASVPNLIVATGRKMLAIALSRDHGAVEVDTVEAPLADITVAVGQILTHGGFMTSDNSLAGEGRAAAPHASIGGLSEGG